MRLRVLARMIEIQRVLLKHGLDDFVRATHLYRPLRFVFAFTPGMWFARRRVASRGERLRLALQELGPIFVKFGQAVSTRRDLLPADIAEELAKLQDRVPPFDGAVAQGIIEAAYGKSVTEVFSRSSSSPWPRRRSHRCMQQSCVSALRTSSSQASTTPACPRPVPTLSTLR